MLLAGKHREEVLRQEAEERVRQADARAAAAAERKWQEAASRGGANHQRSLQKLVWQNLLMCSELLAVRSGLHAAYRPSPAWRTPDFSLKLR